MSGHANQIKRVIEKFKREKGKEINAVHSKIQKEKTVKKTTKK